MAKEKEEKYNITINLENSVLTGGITVNPSELVNQDSGKQELDKEWLLRESIKAQMPYDLLDDPEYIKDMNGYIDHMNRLLEGMGYDSYPDYLIAEGDLDRLEVHKSQERVLSFLSKNGPLTREEIIELRRYEEE